MLVFMPNRGTELPGAGGRYQAYRAETVAGQ